MLIRNFTSEEIFLESVDTDNPRPYGFIVAYNRWFRVELGQSEDKTKWLELYTECENIEIKRMQISVKEDVEIIMKIYEAVTRWPWLRLMSGKDRILKYSANYIHHITKKIYQKQE